MEMRPVYTRSMKGRALRAGPPSLLGKGLERGLGLRRRRLGGLLRRRRCRLGLGYVHGLRRRRRQRLGRGDFGRWRSDAAAPAFALFAGAPAFLVGARRWPVCPAKPHGRWTLPRMGGKPPL
jgi:hypothetical protein